MGAPFCRLGTMTQSEFVLQQDPVLPVIDFSSFHNEDETRSYPTDIVKKLANACEHVGFFYAIGMNIVDYFCNLSNKEIVSYILGHGVPNDLLLRTLNVTRRLFELNPRIKNKYASRLFVPSLDQQQFHVGGLGRGYQSVGENVTNTKRDRHEGFDLYRELEQNHPQRLLYTQENHPHKNLPDYRDLAIGTNPWPEELPEFRETIAEYKTAMLQAGARVMRAIALSLDLPLNYFRSTFNDSFWV